MSKIAVIIAALLPSTTFAAIPASTPSAQTRPLEQSHSASALGSAGARASDLLSMGPDPGGKTGDTVTPATTKIGQPSADGTDGSSQSAASSTSSTSGPETAGGRTDQRRGASGGSDTSKQ